MNDLSSLWRKEMLSQLEDVALSKLQRINECTQVLELILTQERKESITILDDKLQI